MKATEAKLLPFLKSSPQFIIPIYQRVYSWTDEECKQLWDDIVRTGKNDDVNAHFIGSVVYIEESMYQVTNQSPLLVIDGQQRLTTVTLIIEALARHLGNDEPIDGFSARKLRNYHLLNPEESGERHYKLILTQTDKESLLSILDGKSLPPEHSVRVKENFEYFQSKIMKLDDVTSLCKGLGKLMIVDVSLTREQDNPQLIFESMNSTGKELSQADLIRNFVLMGLQPEHQTRLYKDHWRPMEVRFGQDGYNRHFDGFMRNYLTVKTGEIPRQDRVYDAFKKHAASKINDEGGIDKLVAEIHTYADHYCAFALGKEEDRTLADAFKDLRELRVDTSYPFLLELYHDYASASLSRVDFERIVRLIESYVFRRAVVPIPTNSLNKTFATFSRSIRKDRYVESIEAHFLLLPSYRRFPDDEEFLRSITVRDLYNFRSRSYWLRRLENFGRKERVPVDEYTIEHILPQNEDLSEQWQEALGSNWKDVQSKWLHTLGNLTLTGYNSEYSDKAFVEKRDMEGGFSRSPLRVNEGLAQLKKWNEESIQDRADRMARWAQRVWISPKLTNETLDQYRQEKERPTKKFYTIEDHPHLADGSPTRYLFELFRREVLALDPAVTEEFLKLYVAYKAETNFVDAVPQAKRLRLSLNLEFPELQDPKGIAKDTTHIGRWGNGDVEVPLSSLDELPYVMGLVRQALEKQLGNGES